MDMITDAAVVARHVAATLQAPSQARPGEYLTFKLGHEDYGIDILSVQEIRSYEPPTRIANAPPFVKGVVNLRGVIVPIVDLRLKMACDAAGFDSKTAVIVLNVAGRIVGAVVDSVSDVVDLDAGHIKPAPSLAVHMHDQPVTGIACLAQASGERMLVLLDVERLLAADNLAF